MQEAMTAREKTKSKDSMKNFRLEERSELAPGLFALTFDMPGEKVNKLNRESLSELEQILDELKTRNDVKALVVCTGKESIYIAGADITLIQGLKTKADAMEMASSGQAILQKFENMPFPVVAAIHGACMGGGTELSLCCKYIVTSDSPGTRIGLPEVNLGVLPGFGGTVRLPIRVGLQTAMDFILTGKTMDGNKAVKLGFADACLPFQDFNQRALEWAAKIVKGYKPSKNLKKPMVANITSALLEENPIGRAVLFKKAREMIMSKTRGNYPAPLKILDVLASNYGKSITKALEIENVAFGELAVTDVSKRLIELFFATEKVKKMTGVDGAKLDKADTTKSIGLLGAGVMGGGIAQLCAHKNYPIRMKDIDWKGLGLGTAAATKIFSDLVKKKKMSKREADIKFALISPTTDFTGFEHVDVTVEAIVENLDIKKKTLAETETKIKEDSILASNTSSLSIDEMSKALKRPENFVGMHFFNPVNKMPLVEVVRGAKTSDRAVMKIYELSKKLGKTPIVVKDGPGFLVNRLLMPYLNEASYIIESGCNIEELDELVLDFGLPMGPATLLDEIGIDVAVKVAKILHAAFGVRAEPCHLNDKLVDAKLYGKKSNKGFYTYDERGKRGELNPEIYSVLGTSPKSASKEQKVEWVERMIYMMINEAAICFEDEIVTDPMDVDVGMIFGTGFPPFRGGLLRYADSTGLQKVVDRLQEFQTKYGDRFKPSAALVERAKRNRLFYSV